MPTISDVAVCLRRWDFSETSQTVSLLTRTAGVIRGLAKGAKREKGAFSGGFDVLTQGHVVAIVKPTRDLATLTEWRLLKTYRPLRRRLAANRLALYIADLTHHMVTAQDPHPRLYAALDAALEAICDAPSGDAALLAYQWTLLEECGYRPQVARDAETAAPLPADADTLAFSAAAGGVVASADGPGRWRTRASTIRLLQRLDRGQRADAADDASLDRANRLLAAYCREIIGSEPPTLRWVFPDLDV